MKTTKCNLAQNASVHFKFLPTSGDWCQVNFRDADGENTPLHFSIRRKEGIVVANNRNGRDWGEPIIGDLPDAAADGPRSFLLLVEAEQLRVLIDRTEVMQLDRTRFRPERIERIELAAQMQKDTLQVSDVLLDETGIELRLMLGRNLMLYAYSMDEASSMDEAGLEGPVSIGVAGTGVTLPCVIEDRLGAHGETKAPPVALEAILPGYLWTLLEGDDDALVLRVEARRPVIGGTLTVTRGAMAEAINVLAATIQAPEHALFEALSAVEHVRFAGLFPLLSDRAAAFVRATVEMFDLSGFLDLSGHDGIAPPPAGVAAAGLGDTVALQVNACRDRIGTAIRQDPGADQAALLRRTCDAFGFSKSQNLAQLLYPLAEHFCQAGRFESLFRLWQEAGNGADDLPLDQNWGRTISLPFLLMLNDFERLANTFERIAGERKDWINTACIAWTMEAVMRDGGKDRPREQVRAILRAFTTLVDGRARDYWDRAPCHNLIDATVFLLRQRTMFAAERRDHLDRFALRCYGFSVVFWERLRDAMPDFRERSPWLAAGYDANAAIVEHVDAAAGGADPSRAAAEDALDFFDNIGAWEAPRIRLEVFGVSGQLTGSGSPLLSLAFPRSRIEATLLRHLAFPGARDLSIELAPLSRRAIAERLEGGGIAHNHEQIVEAARLAHRLSADMQAGPETAIGRARIDALRAALVGIGGSRNDHVGLGILLGVLGDAVLAGQDGLVEHLSVHAAEQVDALDMADGTNRLLRGAVSRFAYISDETGHGLARSLAARIAGKARFPSRLAAKPDPAMLELWLKTPGIFDTLVLVYSCRANLETRIAQLRASWLARLEEFGIPCLIVVGDGKGEVRGDLLEVDAPDSYEGLPQKTLAMMRWVHANTNFANVLKVDDDCYLDVEEYFYSLSHRRHNYYGRRLTRRIGQKPRAWHMSRAAGPRGRMELDKSPEPSSFADGGSGYALSRDALKALADISAKAQGQRLIQVSYSEDKLVGDLLSLAGMKPNSEGNTTALFRTTHDGGRAVMRWERNFFPSVMSGTKLAHLDNRGGFRQIDEDYGKGRLTPRILWPTNRKVSLKSDAGLMVLMSDEDRLENARTAPVSVISVVRNEMFMLPHFLAHYRKLGVTSFMFVDNCSDDGTFEYLLDQPDTVVLTADTSFRNAAQGSDWKLAMMAQFRVGKWCLIADADELLVYPGYETTPLDDHLAGLQAGPEFAPADAVLTMMLDMYPEGRLADVTFASGNPFAEAGHVDRRAFLSSSVGRGAFGNRLTRTSSLRHRLMPNSRPELFVSEKVALVKYKPWMRFSVSFHYATEVKLAAQPMVLAHFKYNAEFIDKAQREIRRGQYFNGAEEYKKYVAILSEAQDVVYDENVSVPWLECEEMRELFGERSA